MGAWHPVCLPVTFYIWFVKQIMKCKDDLSALQYQNTQLRNQIKGSSEVQFRGGTPVVLGKQERHRTPDPETSDSSGSLHKQARVNLSSFSRKQIRSVLGGSDRGLGSTWYVPAPHNLHLPVSLMSW